MFSDEKSAHSAVSPQPKRVQSLIGVSHKEGKGKGSWCEPGQPLIAAKDARGSLIEWTFRSRPRCSHRASFCMFQSTAQRPRSRNSRPFPHIILPFGPNTEAHTNTRNRSIIVISFVGGLYHVFSSSLSFSTTTMMGFWRARVCPKWTINLRRSTCCRLATYVATRLPLNYGQIQPNHVMPQQYGESGVLS